MSGRMRSIAIFGLAGIISGILTLHPPLPRDFLPNLQAYLGVTFGIILAIFLGIFHPPRSIAKAVAVVVSSTVAYNAAMLSTFFGYMLTAHFFDSSAQSPNPPIYVMFIGGVVGAMVISTTVLLLYRDESMQLGQAILLCTFGGGILGVFGYALGLLFTGPVLKPADTSGMLFLHLLWPAGMGCLLGAYLPAPVWRAQTQPSGQAFSLSRSAPLLRATHARKVPLWGKLFIGLVTLFLISWIARTTWVEHNFRRQLEVFTKYQQARPSLENLESIVPMANEQAVILYPIAGRTADLWGQRTIPATTNQPPSVTFTACYMHRPEYRCLANPPDVKVQVSQWSNSQWSTYELQGIQYRYTGYSTHPKKIQKFGNTMMAELSPKDPGIGKFYWTSNAVLIVLDSDASDSDEFIRQYLERYPSSL